MSKTMKKHSVIGFARSKILLSALFASLLAAPVFASTFASTFASHDLQVKDITLENLVSGSISLENVVKFEATVKQLEELYRLKQGITEKEKKKFLNKNREKIKNFRKAEKTLSSHSAFFYGSPDRAVDSNGEEDGFYHSVLVSLEQLVQHREINATTYEKSTTAISALRFWHKNNQQISQEAQDLNRVPTYNRQFSELPLHWNTRELPFEGRAPYLYKRLRIAFEFAAANQQLANLFTDALSKAQGCLEARFAGLETWLAEKECYFQLSHQEQVRTLSGSAEKVIFQACETRHGMVEYENLGKHVREICEENAGKIDADGMTVTPQKTRDLLKLCAGIVSPERGEFPSVERGDDREEGMEVIESMNRMNIDFKEAYHLSRCRSPSPDHIPRKLFMEAKDASDEEAGPYIIWPENNS